MMTPEERARRLVELLAPTSRSSDGKSPALEIEMEIRAAVNEALERAAAVLEKDHIVSGSFGPLHSMGWEQASQAHAAYLRSLKHPEPGT